MDEAGRIQWIDPCAEKVNGFLWWVDDVEEDLRKMGVRGWRRKVKEKNEWADVIKEAKVLQGL
jgi:hypothetical protein